MSKTWLDSRNPAIDPGDSIVFARHLIWMRKHAESWIEPTTQCNDNCAWCGKDGEIWAHEHILPGSLFIYLGKDDTGRHWVFSPRSCKARGLGVSCFDYGYRINP